MTYTSNHPASSAFQLGSASIPPGRYTIAVRRDEEEQHLVRFLVTNGDHSGQQVFLDHIELETFDMIAIECKRPEARSFLELIDVPIEVVVGKGQAGFDVATGEGE